jgi:hypothetical protein
MPFSPFSFFAPREENPRDIPILPDPNPPLGTGDYGVRGAGANIIEELFRRRAADEREKPLNLGYDIVSKVIDYFPRGGDTERDKAVAPTGAAETPEEETAEKAEKRQPTAPSTPILAISPDEKRPPVELIQPQSGGAINPSELQMLVDKEAASEGRTRSDLLREKAKDLRRERAPGPRKFYHDPNLKYEQPPPEKTPYYPNLRGLARPLDLTQTGAVETPEERARREALESLGVYPQVRDFPDQDWQRQMQDARDRSGQTASEEYYRYLRDQRLRDIEGQQRFPTDLLTGENLLTGKEILSVMPSDPRTGAGPPNIRGVRPRDKWLTSESIDPETGKSMIFQHSELNISLNDPRLTGDPTGRTFTYVPSIYDGRQYEATENIISEIRPTIKINPDTGERYWYDKDSNTIRKLELYQSAEEAEAAMKKRSEDIDEYNQWQTYYRR